MARMLKYLIQFLCGLLFVFILMNVSGCQSTLLGFLNPKGLIALEEKRLFYDTLALMLIVVLPVIVMSFTFVYHYQISHRIREYKPNWGHSYLLESLWWGIPCIIIVVLAILTWKKSHQLDPFNRIVSQNPNTLLVQGIALPWKWLFIYPQYNIAMVNYLMLPIGQQIEFSLTTDNVPMSAFFIPQLGGQIYTMAGMRSRLHLLATHPGILEGMNTQFNGPGFSEMHFPVYVVEENQFTQLLAKIKQSSQQPLTDDAYNDLLKPTIGDKSQFFSGVSEHLFDRIIQTYLHSQGPIHPRFEQGNPYYSRKYKD